MTVGELKLLFVLEDRTDPKVKAAEQKFKSSAERLKGIVKGISKTFSSMGNVAGVALGNIAANIVQNIGRALVMTAKETAKFAAEFESSFAKIENLVGLSEKAVGELSKAVLALAPAVGVGPRELADALFVITSAGKEGKAALEILEAAARASALGLGETATVARVVTAAIAAYGEENLTASRATEILAVTVRKGNLEAASLAPVLGRVLGIAAEMGVTFEEVGASIATYTLLGVGAEEATTGLRGALNLILNPGKETQEVLDKIGISAEELRKKVAEDGLQKALDFLLTAIDGNQEALGQLIPNVRALALVLGTAGSQAEKYADNLKELKKDSDVVGEGFKNVTETLEFQQEAYNATAEVAKIAFGTVLLPVMADATEAATSTLGSFIDLGTATGNLADAVGNLKGPFGEASGSVDELDKFLRGIIEKTNPEFLKTMEEIDGSVIKAAAKFNIFTITIDGLAKGIDDILVPALNAYGRVQAFIANQLGLSTTATEAASTSTERYADTVDDIIAELEAEESALKQTEKHLKTLAEAERKLAAKKALEEKLKRLKESADKLTETYKDLAAELAVGVTKGLEASAREAKALEERLVFLTKEGLDSGEEFGRMTLRLEALRKTLKAAGAEMKVLGTDTTESSKEMAKARKEYLKTIPPLKALGGAATKTAEVVQTAMGKIVGALSNIGEHIKFDVSEEIEQMGVVLATNLRGMGGKLQQFFGASGPWGAGLAIGLGVLKEFGVDFEGVFKKVLGELGKAVGEFVKAFGVALGIGGVKSEIQIAIGDAFDKLGEGFDQIAAKSAVLGEEFDRAGAEISLLEGIMVDLLLSGVKPSEPAYIRLAAALAKARSEGLLVSEFFENFWAQTITSISDLSSLDLGSLTLPGGFGDFGTIIGDIFASIDEHIAGLTGAFDEAAVRAGLLQQALDDYTAAGGTNSFVIDALTAAIARLGETSSATAEGFGTWVSSAESLVAILLTETIPALEAEAEVAAALGLEYDLTAKKQAAYKDLIEKLAKTLGLNSPVVQDLIDQYHALGGATEFVVMAEVGLEDARRRGAEFTREYTDEEQRLIDLLEEELRIKGILAGIEEFLLDRTTRITAEFGQFADGAAQASDMIRLLNEAMIRMREDGLEGTDMFTELSRQLEAWQTRLADITEEAKRAAKEAGKIRKEQEEGGPDAEIIKVGDIKVKIKFPSRIAVQLESLSETVKRQLSQPLFDMVRLWTGSPTAAGLSPVLPGPAGSGEITINVLMDGRRVSQLVAKNLPGIINLRMGSGTS